MLLIYCGPRPSIRWMSFVRKLLFWIGCICLCMASAVAQPGKSDASLYSVSGDVASLHEVFYKAEYRNGKLEKGDRFHDEGLFESFMAFDDAGYKTLEYRFGPEGDTSFQITYHYDAYLNRTGVEFNYPNGTSRKIRYNLTYAQGRVVEYAWQLPDGSIDGRVTFIYDSIGHVAEESCYNGNGLLAEKQTWKYDASGQVAESAMYDA